MSDFEIVMAGPAPALNRTYKVNLTGGRHVYKDSKVTVWQDSVAWLIKAARPRGWVPAQRVLITIEWYSARKRDCDSGVKAALDAVAVGLGVDDSIFLLSVPVNEVDRANTRTVIRVENVYA